MFQDLRIFFKGLLLRLWMPAVVVALAAFVVLNLSHYNMPKAILPVGAIIGAAGAYLLIQNPKSIVFTILVFSFYISHLSRYSVPGPIGLTIDVLLGLALIVLLTRKRKGDFQHLNKPEIIALLIWVAYTWIEIINPISPGPIAWFYAMRAISLYFILLPLISSALIDEVSDLKKVFVILISLGLFVTYVAIRQNVAGMNGKEMAWLMTGPITQHFIHGKMRVFSILTDASSYGAFAAYLTTVMGIYAAYTETLRYRMFYIFVAILSFYGMMLSGSRGPLAIIGVGGMVYLIFSRKVGMALTGGLVGGGFFVFLKYTSIGSGNYNIVRLRSALDPNDASLLVRKAKEAILSVYMRDKPIGGGIGSAGNWGERFAPGSFLAETPTDGLYSRIWMETGIIGLYLYVGLFIFLSVMMGIRLWKLPNSLVRQRLLGLYCGFVGLVVASYVNELITQFPLSMFAYMTPVLIFLVEQWYKEGRDLSDPELPLRPPLD